jgi:lipoprotein LpqH
MLRDTSLLRSRGGASVSLYRLQRTRASHSAKRGIVCRHSVVIAATVVFATACSSGAPAASRATGSLPPGTLKISINGRSSNTPYGADCTHISSYTTVRASAGDSSVRAVLNAASSLAPVSVEIANIDGFTGSYQADLMGRAYARLTGSTVELFGVAGGFYSQDPSHDAQGDFTIDFAC